VPAKKSAPSFKSLHRALAILSSFSFSRPRLSASDIASYTDIPKSTVHRFLRIFVEQGFLEETESPGLFAPGLKLFELGNIVHQNLDVRLSAKSPMDCLAKAYNTTVHLVIRDRDEGVYVEKVEPVGQHVHYSNIGKRIPLYCTAAGKILLSDLTDEAIFSLLPSRLPSLTPHTIVEREVLLNEIHKVQEKGWAEDNQELELGLCCVAVPIKDHQGHIAAAMSTSGLAASFGPERKSELIKGLQGASMEVSRQLGFP